MGRNLQSGERLRPVDLARVHGLSTQAVRNYEEAGILPVVAALPGYRTYTSLHAGALRAFLALVPGHGHQTAASIMRAVNQGAVDEALRLIDESHTQLLDDRRSLQAVERALRGLESTATSEPNAVSGPAGEVHRAAGGELGIRPATLRKWERAGLVRPRRDPRTGYRVYDEADMRDARLARQLRRGGYLLEQIAPLIAQVRTAAWAGAAGGHPARLARSAVRPRARDAGRGRRAGGVPPRARMRCDPARPARSPPRTGGGSPP